MLVFLWAGSEVLWEMFLRAFLPNSPVDKYAHFPTHCQAMFQRQDQDTDGLQPAMEGGFNY